jgi:uncharacterized protein
MSSEQVTVRSSDGLALEGAIDEPGDVARALVLCHPHPKMGGTMNAPLLCALSDRLVGEGWVVLRFNFRGIGSSEGAPGTGVDEVNDAEGAIALMKDRYPEAPLAISGWSFGAAVAVRVASAHPELAACVGIAPAVKARTDVTAGLPDAENFELDVPTLFVCAANDDLVSVADCRGWADVVGGAEVVEIPGANHFFWAKYDDLSDTVSGWLDKVV